MRIAAEDLETWAAEPEARITFPALLRRLVAHAGGRLRRLDMPSGSGADLSGWDGMVEAARGNAWVPAGSSRWELSCEARIAKKARADFEKRTRETGPEERARLAFVFATPREWRGKKREAWLAEARSHGWREVRALDAHDLVQWLEQAPAVALWLGETLGHTGFGLESVDRFFARWSTASQPAITARALAVGRAWAPRASKQAIKDWLASQSKDKNPKDEQLEGKPKSEQQARSTQIRLTIRADSEEEAAAFAASVLMRNGRLAARAAVVTAPPGWTWVAQNPDLQVVLCASSELAKEAPAREGLLVLVPHARGDLSPFATAEAPASEGAKGPELLLPRPDEVSFAKALQKLGIEEPRAGVLSRRCGRSWSVFRRLHATDPASRTPPWLERPEARALGTLALFGAFSEREGDRKLVEEVAGRPWEEIERDLRILADRADPPVLEIDGVWKAKAIAELFLVAGPRIIRGELDRFLAVAQRVLSGRDRSGRTELVTRFLGDSLVRLAVLGPGCLRAEPGIEARVRRLVHDLLAEADADRWHSLAPRLRYLAEAAPDAFLAAVDRNLRHAREAGSSLGSALAVLGWSTDHFGWVVDILGRIRSDDPDDTAGVAPDRLLLDLFRPWFPQTTAGLDQRLEALDALGQRYPDPAFELVCGMLPGYDTASLHLRPAWRDAWLTRIPFPDEDPQRAVENLRAVESAADRAIALAEGNPDRLAKLVERLDGLRTAGRQKALLDALVRFARTNPPDEARRRLRAALGGRIARDEATWEKPFPLRPSALPLARLWRAFAPRDPVLRHAWLFDQRWASLPGHLASPGARERVSRRRRERAAGEIRDAAGIEGLFRLAEAAKWPQLVGEAAVDTGIDPRALVEEALARGAFGCGPKRAVQDCVLTAIGNASPTYRRAPLETLVAALFRLGRPAAEIAEVLAPYRADPAVRDLIEAQPQDVRHELRLRSPRDADDIRALLAAGRPVAALDAALRGGAPMPGAPLLEILEKLAELGPEPNADTNLPSHVVADAVRRLEDERFVDRHLLAEVELALLPSLASDGTALVARTLFDRLTSDPEFFVELLQAAFRAQGEPPRALDPAATRRAEGAAIMFQWEIRFLRRCPGQRADGTIDCAELNAFVDRARELARANNRLTVCDYHLGWLLAFAPAGPDGQWPCEEVADLVDRPNLKMLREGFACGSLNIRGSTPSSLKKDTDQNAAKKLRADAQLSSVRYPRTAASLRNIAEDLEGTVRNGKQIERRFSEGLW